MEIRRDNVEARNALAEINDSATFARITAERAFLARLKAGCQTPVGAYTWFEDDGDVMGMSVRVFDEGDPGAEPFVAEVRGTSSNPEGLADLLMEKRNSGAFYDE
ncbi:MAG: hypothetical protein AAGC68_09725 [Verrucomicrobiota bacterium]